MLGRMPVAALIKYSVCPAVCPSQNPDATLETWSRGGKSKSARFSFLMKNILRISQNVSFSCFLLCFLLLGGSFYFLIAKDSSPEQV